MESGTSSSQSRNRCSGPQTTMTKTTSTFGVIRWVMGFEAELLWCLLRNSCSVSVCWRKQTMIRFLLSVGWAQIAVVIRDWSDDVMLMTGIKLMGGICVESLRMDDTVRDTTLLDYEMKNCWIRKEGGEVTTLGVDRFSERRENWRF